jgi:hypothetical protein
VRLGRRARRSEEAGFGRRAQALDPETVRRLRALGYVDAK